MRDQYEKNIIKQCFKDKEVLLKCVERITDETVFSDKITRLFWQIFIMIYKNGDDIHYSVVLDILKYTKNDELVDNFDEITNGTYIDEGQWEYQLSFILENFKKEKLLELSDLIKNEIPRKNSSEIAELINTSMVTLNSSEIKSTTFANAYKDTLEQIKKINSGNVKSLIETGQPKFDNIVSLSRNKFILVASQKKIGKTRYITHLIDKIIEYNMDVDIQWYSFEMSKQEMIMLYLSRQLRLTEKQMLGINYKLSPHEIAKIEAAFTHFAHYPIEFIDETCNIFQLCSRFERFAEKSNSKGRIPICVIDNLGCIKPHSQNDTQNEDDISRMLKDLRDKSKGIVFLLHHMTKESESKFNITEMYKPKVNHIRGSSRLVDFANIVLLLHRPEHYPDIVKYYTNKNEFQVIDKLMEVDCALNRNGQMDVIHYRHELQFSDFTEI